MSSTSVSTISNSLESLTVEPEVNSKELAIESSKIEEEKEAARSSKLSQLADARFLLSQMKLERSILYAWKQQIDQKKASLQTFEVALLLSIQVPTKVES